jgi:hypothetical protein
MRVNHIFHCRLVLITLPLLALCVAPLLGYAVRGWHHFPRGYVMFWPRYIEHFMRISIPVTVVVYAVTLLSFVLWFRRPGLYTALLLCFTVIVMCGVPGASLLTLATRVF